MKYKIKFTGSARNDLQDAADYISGELFNPAAARRLILDAREMAFSLEAMPVRYALVDDGVLARQGFRCFPVHNYLLFYIVREEGKAVMIERFLYGRRDWLTILKGDR
jgi:toxin ParE1/3/4